MTIKIKNEPKEKRKDKFKFKLKLKIKVKIETELKIKVENQIENQFQSPNRKENIEIIRVENKIKTIFLLLSLNYVSLLLSSNK